LRNTVLLLSIPLLLFSCEQKIKINQTEKKIGTHINCANEKYLIENTNNNSELLFDTILTTKDYWKCINRNQSNSIGKKLFPYVKVKLDTPTFCKEINISLIGYGEWKADSRLKIVINDDKIDSLSLMNFFHRISNNLDTTETRNKSEIFISFSKDTIIDITKNLKKLAYYYFEFQKQNSKSIFNLDICELERKQLDSLKKRTPFRIRPMKEL
jgi:hypothetical protein